MKNVKYVELSQNFQNVQGLKLPSMGSSVLVSGRCKQLRKSTKVVNQGLWYSLTK